MSESPLSHLCPGEYPWLLAMTALATYLCVPETDQMPAIGAMVLALAVVELIARRASGAIVQIVAAAIVLWSGLYGATGRGSAIVGAIFAFWPLVLVASAVLWLRWRERPAVRVLQRFGVGLIGGVAAVAVARTGALQPAVRPALVAVAVAGVVSAVLALAIVSQPGRTGEGRRTR
jgi:hypothetical protein